MKADKYNRKVELLCPTCGCSQFETENGELSEVVKCASCGREILKDELIHENEENINEHIKEIGEEVTKDIKKELEKILKRF